jgi:hypothetical protein
MAAMQRLLGTSEKFVNPNFGSAFIFELRQSKIFRTQYYVRVLNKNTLYPGAISFDVVKIKGNFLSKTNLEISFCTVCFYLKGCGEFCPIQKFLKLTSNKFVENYTTACKIN